MYDLERITHIPEVKAIAVDGAAKAGKDFFAEMLAEILSEHSIDSVLISAGNAFRAMTALIIGGFDLENLSSDMVAEYAADSDNYEYLQKNKDIVDNVARVSASYRAQKLGQEVLARWIISAHAAGQVITINARDPVGWLERAGLFVPAGSEEGGIILPSQVLPIIMTCSPEIAAARLAGNDDEDDDEYKKNLGAILKRRKEDEEREDNPYIEPTNIASSAKAWAQEVIDPDNTTLPPYLHIDNNRGVEELRANAGTVATAVLIRAS